MISHPSTSAFVSGCLPDSGTTQGATQPPRWPAYVRTKSDVLLLALWFVAARAKITPRASGGKTHTLTQLLYFINMSIPHNTRMVAKYDDKCNRDVHYMRHPGLVLAQKAWA
jgi:hypothetical protein